MEEEPTQLIDLGEQAGYDYRHHVRLSQQRWFLDRLDFADGGQWRIFHLHIMNVQPDEKLAEILFRDFLCSHQDYCRRYEEAKLLAVRAAAAVKGKQAKKEAYMSTKDPIIREIMKEIAKDPTN